MGGEEEEPYTSLDIPPAYFCDNREGRVIDNNATLLIRFQLIVFIRVEGANDFARIHIDTILAQPLQHGLIHALGRIAVVCCLFALKLFDERLVSLLLVPHRQITCMAEKVFFLITESCHIRFLSFHGCTQLLYPLKV